MSRLRWLTVVTMLGASSAIAEESKGQVLFIVSPWADVYFKGERLATTPMKPQTVPVGKQIFTLKNTELDLERTVAVEVVAGQTTKFRFDMIERKATEEVPTTTERLGRLLIDVEPWADVLVDGKYVGTTPMKPMELPAGNQTITLRNTELEFNTQMTVRIVAGEQTRLAFDLSDRFEAFSKTKTAQRQTIERAADGYGSVEFKIRPWAEIYWYGNQLGSTPLPAIRIPAGVQTFELRNSDLGISKTVKIEVKANEVTRVKFNFGLPRQPTASQEGHPSGELEELTPPPFIFEPMGKAKVVSR